MRAELRSDPMLGTAFPAARVFCVEQPGPWGRQGLLQSHFDPVIGAEVIGRLDAVGIRVLTIRRPGRHPDPAGRSWFLADCRDPQGTVAAGSFESDGALLQLAQLLAGSASSDRIADARSRVRPLYLVCAHGSHDVCCAVRGRPVAAALAEVRPDQVWECSHVGGDRFAANVLVLPSGLLYGSVHVAEARSLIDATERGQALAGPLRGKIGLEPEVQAALACAYQYWGGRVADIRVRSVLRSEDGSVAVELERRRGLSAALGRVRVTSEPAPVHRLTCQMTTPATVRVYRPGPLQEHRAE